MVSNDGILLTLIIENLCHHRTCLYYQGDEEPCLRGNHFLTCNCCCDLLKCEFLSKYNKKYLDEPAEW